MTALEQQLLEALRALDSAVTGIAQANPKPDLLPLFAQLEALTAQLPRGTNPDLLHYMHRKSYQKAIALLQERVAASD